MGFFYNQKKTPIALTIGVFDFQLNEHEQEENKSMPEIIAVILQKVEVVMEKHGYWRVVGAILLGITIWQLSNIINALVALAVVFK